jgi:hypothetical protein
MGRIIGDGRATSTRGETPTVSTQEAVYADIDLDLSWSEHELPERERTKHVHRLHPYLGKYVPQLVETFLSRYANEGDLVWDPFCGSGTTLVEANAFGARAAGCDVSAFNCLLSRVKTARYEPATLLTDAVRLTAAREPTELVSTSAFLRRWYAPRAVAQLLAFRERISGTAYPDLWSVVLSRAARSARLARHDDLDFPREPVGGEYFCHKHRRTCRPVNEADKFLRRYVQDATRRVLEFAETRTRWPVTVVHGNARHVEPPGRVDLVVTSPPYPGLIDYHDQHAYAFELLGLERRDEEEIGRGVRGYCDGVAEVLRRAADALTPRGRIVVVVNDSRGLYERICEQAGLRLEQRLRRHVNRRTGRRRGEYFEDVLVLRG